MAGKGKRGRPAWIPTPEILQQVEAMAGRFLKEEQIATLVGIHPNQFPEKKRNFPELAEAIRRGRAKVAVNISNKVYEVGMKGNPQMLIFLAKAIVGLKENDPTVQESVTFNVFTSKGEERLQFSNG
jgi:hypothetical protein